MGIHWCFAYKTKSVSKDCAPPASITATQNVDPTTSFSQLTLAVVILILHEEHHRQSRIQFETLTAPHRYCHRLSGTSGIRFVKNTASIITTASVLGGRVLWYRRGEITPPRQKLPLKSATELHSKHLRLSQHKSLALNEKYQKTQRRVALKWALLASQRMTAAACKTSNNNGTDPECTPAHMGVVCSVKSVSAPEI